MIPRRDAPPWLERAHEARTIAERTHDPDARLTMLRIAENYEQLAQAYDLPAPCCRDPSAAP